LTPCWISNGLFFIAIAKYKICGTISCTSTIYSTTGGYMEAKSYSAVRKDLSNTMERVCKDHTPVIITRKNSNSVVMMSLDDYNSIEETAYLLRSPANAERLRRSIKQAEDGKVTAHNLIG
jgi:antitoxin YefM